MKSRHRDRFLVLPVCVLLLNATEDLVLYKAELIPNPHLDYPAKSHSAPG